MAAMNTLPVPEPVFVLRYNLKDITHDITAYATSITFTDKLSGESDELEVELEDSEQLWRDAWYPGMGDTLALQLGFQGNPLTDCGGFSIDEIELSGPPDSVSIRGRSAPVTRAMRTKSNRGFENTTLAAIAGRIARKHKLKLEGQIEPLTLERITQYGESDLAFLKRLAQDYGYMVKVTPEKLIFSHLGKLRDAPVIRTITPQEVSRWTLRDTLHEVYKGVKNRHQNSQTRTLVTYKADGTKDTRVSATDSVIFATDSDVLLMAGALSVQVHATCTEAGIVGNGWQPAQISNLLDDIEGADFQVVAIAPSSGGAEAESNDHLRERIILAPESFSNAGSKGAYRFHAMSAHQDIVDVAVTRPQPGTVKLTPLMSYGMPEQAILDAIAGICSDEKIRPLTDTVITSLPDEVTYAINATLIVYASQDEKAVIQHATQSITAWERLQSSRLGRDIIPSQISAALSVPGVYKVALDSTSEHILDETQWAHCTGIRLIPGGKVNG